MLARVATTDDLAAVTETITVSFHRDPVWSWAFPDDERRPAQYTALWGLMIGSAMRYPWVRVTEGCEAAAVWIPPGVSEFSPEDEARLEPLLEELLGRPQADRVLELMERFDEAHSVETPHYYLSLLGTHDDHRGKGIGMALLAENLALIDAEGMPAYLESTNPGNDKRYQRVGFEPFGSFSAPDGGPTVTTMWREPRQPGEQRPA
jgi:GNAT superfamily N-acetyltransferase